MGQIVVMNHVTLDGVMQAPGRPDEDTRDGFAFGGWAARLAGGDDPADAAGADVARAMGERIAAGGGLAGWIFGRRTYEDLLGYWNQQPDSAFGPMLNGSPKYVASSVLAEPLPWPNSTLLRDDVPQRVRALKAETSGVLAIMGSGELIQSLIGQKLIDEFMLMIHPLVLGSGRRLFPQGMRLPFRLADSGATSAGIVIARYATHE